MGEGGFGAGRGVDRPVALGIAAVPVEPHQRLNTRKLVWYVVQECSGDPVSFRAALLRRRGFADHQRLGRRDRGDLGVAVGAALYAASEDLAERQPGPTTLTLVVAVQTNPVDVGVTGIELSHRARAAARNVRAPHPAHVRRTQAGEYVVHVPPGFDVVARLVAVEQLGPGELPVAVHFVVEAQEERVAPSFGGGGPLANRAVVLARGDAGQSEVGLGGSLPDIPGEPVDHGYRASPPHCLEEVGLKYLRFAAADPGLAPVHDRLALAGAGLEGVQRRLSVWRAWQPRAPVDRRAGHCRGRQLQIGGQLGEEHCNSQHHGGADQPVASTGPLSVEPEAPPDHGR